MKNALAKALRLLQERLGEPHVAAWINRVNPGDSGTLDFELQTDGGLLWFRYDGEELCPIHPEQDELLAASQLVASTSVLSWRPRRRIVLASRQEPATVLKGYRRKRSEGAAHRHRLAMGVAGSAREGFRVPALLERDEEHEVLVFEAVDGEPVSLSKADADFHFRLGLALQRWQQAVPSADLQRFGPQEELQVLRRWRSRCDLALGSLPENWEGVYRRTEAFAAQLECGAEVVCHRDLHDGQIAEVEDGRPLLLDFDLLCRADPALDPANLLAHYALRQVQGTRGADVEGVQACADALFEGLQPGGPSFWRSLRFYEATSFLRLALVYSLRPRWRKASPALVALATRCLDESAVPIQV